MTQQAQQTALTAEQAMDKIYSLIQDAQSAHTMQNRQEVGALLEQMVDVLGAVDHG
jgi:hypothetical protein